LRTDFFGNLYLKGVNIMFYPMSSATCEVLNTIYDDDKLTGPILYKASQGCDTSDFLKTSWESLRDSFEIELEYWFRQFVYAEHGHEIESGGALVENLLRVAPIDWQRVATLLLEKRNIVEGQPFAELFPLPGE
jgi:hypothetical protein